LSAYIPQVQIKNYMFLGHTCQVGLHVCPMNNIGKWTKPLLYASSMHHENNKAGR
jgi:hypothetical protein